jgi:hypothetical protein
MFMVVPEREIDWGHYEVYEGRRKVFFRVRLRVGGELGMVFLFRGGV